MKMLWDEFAAAMSYKLPSCFQDKRAPFLLRLDEMLNGHFIEQLRFDWLACSVIDDMNGRFHTTINSAFFFSSSSKKSFSPRLRRSSTIW